MCVDEDDDNVFEDDRVDRADRLVSMLLISKRCLALFRTFSALEISSAVEN